MLMVTTAPTRAMNSSARKLCPGRAMDEAHSHSVSARVTLRLLVPLVWLLAFVLAPSACDAAAASKAPRRVQPVIVVFAHDRASHLRQALRSISAASVNLSTPLPVIVSIDDGPRFARVEQAAQRDNVASAIWRHQLPSPSPTADRDHPRLDVRNRISLHYRDTLTRLFSNASVSHALIFEDDLRLSGDGLSLLLCSLQHTWPYVSDSDVMATSLWNDNARARQPGLWTLTSFFPGLGWSLSWALWEQLQHDWPPSSSERDKNKTSSIVGTGWDFWLRVRFHRQNWLVLTPATPRVRHVGSGSGSAGGGNVMPSQQRQHFDNARVADSQVNWCAEFDTASGKVSVKTYVERLTKMNRTQPFDRFQFDQVAAVYRLWPTPRGFFRHVLPILDDIGAPLLLYDRVRAPQFFPHLNVSTSTVTASSGTPTNTPPPHPRTTTFTTFLVARQNQSCAEACALLDFAVVNHGDAWACSKRALDLLNDCKAVERLFSNASSNTLPGNTVEPCAACAYETGPDLPARVRNEAPLATRGLCLVTEATRYDCGGRFGWTQRACGCERQAPANSEAAGGDSGDDDTKKVAPESELEMHDEL